MEHLRLQQVLGAVDKYAIELSEDIRDQFEELTQQIQNECGDALRERWGKAEWRSFANSVVFDERQNKDKRARRMLLAMIEKPNAPFSESDLYFAGKGPGKWHPAIASIPPYIDSIRSAIISDSPLNPDNHIKRIDQNFVFTF